MLAVRGLNPLKYLSVFCNAVYFLRCSKRLSPNPGSRLVAPECGWGCPVERTPNWNECSATDNIFNENSNLHCIPDPANDMRAEAYCKIWGCPSLGQSIFVTSQYAKERTLANCSFLKEASHIALRANYHNCHTTLLQSFSLFYNVLCVKKTKTIYWKARYFSWWVCIFIGFFNDHLNIMLDNFHSGHSFSVASFDWNAIISLEGGGQ